MIVGEPSGELGTVLRYEISFSNIMNQHPCMKGCKINNPQNKVKQENERRAGPERHFGDINGTVCCKEMWCSVIQVGHLSACTGGS